MSLGIGKHPVPPGMLAMVVTDLDMKTPAPLRGAALPSGLDFAALPRDVDTYRDLFQRVGGPWLWSSRLEMDRGALDAILSNPAVEVWTLVKDGQPEAILELDFRTAGECELGYFGLTPALIGSGAGAYLMDRAIERAFSRDAVTRFHVNTCTLDSPQALNFYIRSGFTPWRRRMEIAEDPRATGHLPKDAAPQIPFIKG